MKAYTIVLLLGLFAAAALAEDATKMTNDYAKWSRGPNSSGDYFPIAVWLQDPANAAKYKAAGINVYVALWEGPTAAQLDQLRAVGMPVICDQNEYALAHLDDPIIVGWMHGDEPDNAQALTNPGGRGYGPPILPATIIADYAKIKKNDPTRPVMLNLGQGVAWDGYHGRGVRTNRPEDYPQYVKGGDIVSFDIYPAVHSHPDIAGNLWYVAHGVQRLVTWTEGKKVSWTCIEASRIGNVNVVPTGAQVRSEVWMAIIHGSKGLIYFVHQFQPKFVEASLLANPELLAAVTATNKQVQALAPVINSFTVEDLAAATSANEAVPLKIMTKRRDGAIYIFAVSMRDENTTGAFTVKGLKAGTKVEVLGESRTLAAAGGGFTDAFAGYAVHLYRIAE